MWKWIVLGILFVLLVWFLRAKEGFQNSTSYEDQRNYYHYQEYPVENPGMLPVDPGIIKGPSAISMTALDQAVRTVGYSMNPASITNGISKFLSTAFSAQQKVDASCMGAARPANLKGDTAFMVERARQGEGCGWWYVDNLYTPSTGAYGTAPTMNNYGVQTDAGGPRDPEIPTKYPGGQWVWNLDEADKLEHIKRCKRIQNCDLIDGVDDCAFCPSKGYAVPVDSEGVLKYPNDEEANCGSVASMVRHANKCPMITLQPRLTNYDYDYDTNGNVIAEGENSQALAQVGQTLEFICAGSTLSKNCRLALCKELAGCTEGRGLHRIVQQNGILNETDRLAVRYLADRGSLRIPPAFLESGDISKSDAMDLMRRIQTTAMNSNSAVAKAAALWMINETPFDVCMYTDSDVGPFPVECIQREFRKVGCQASGTAYPFNPNAFVGMNFGTIKTQFRDLYDQMTDISRYENVRKQDEAVQRCLGISMVRDTNEIWQENSNLCRDPGIEYWVYSIPTPGRIILLGRMVVPNLLKTEATNKTNETVKTKELRALLESAKGFRGYTARTFVDVGTTATQVSLELPTNDLNDNYTVYVNGEKTNQLTGITLQTQQRNSIVIQFEIHSGSEFGAPVLTVTPANRLVLPQSAWKPFINLGILPGTGIFKDINEYLPIQSTSILPFPKGGGGVQGTREGLVILERPIEFELTRGVAYTAMKTLTVLFYWNSLTGEPTILQWNQGGTLLALKVIDQFPTLLIQSASGSKGLFQFRSSARLGSEQWVHIALLLGTKVQMWVNGTQVYDPMKKEAVDTTAQYTRFVMGSPGFNGAISWVHVYDRRLTASEITRDAVYDSLPRV